MFSRLYIIYFKYFSCQKKNLEHDDVDLWREEAEEAHVGAQRDGYAQGHDLDLGKRAHCR